MPASQSPRRRRLLAAVGVAAATSIALVASTGATPAAAKKPARPGNVKLQILAINDFHGQLEPSTSSSSGVINGTPAGGAEYLATHLRKLRQLARSNGRHTVTVAAGDLIGATPLISAAFHDEPTIMAMNRMGLQIASVGNHEFDEGWRELRRMQTGGCLADGDGKDNQNSCAAGRFPGANFQYLSANVTRKDTGKTVFPAVKVQKYDGVKVGFIGMTLENTPNIVTKSGVEGLRFSDEVATANRLAKRMDRNGVKSIVVLVHEGGFPSDPTAYNSCPGISGPIVDINKALSPRIDAVITGHTHQAYNCKLKDPNDDRRLVTSGSSLGRLVTNIKLTVNRKTGDVIRRSETARNRIITRDVAKRPTITNLIARFKKLVAPIENRVIGHLAAGTTSVGRTADDSGESPLGNLIADAQRNDPTAVTGGRVPEIAFMNPGGIRNDLQSTAGSVTFGQAFSVQPFNNYDVAMDMTGAQILSLLDQQWSGPNAASPKVLQVSGITYSYSKSGTTYTLRPETVQVNGAPIDRARTYRVVANSFLSDGGDGFPAFAAATNKFFGGLDIDAFSRYLAAHDPYTPAPTDRITLVP
jgi:5'-nucleotidase